MKLWNGQRLFTGDKGQGAAADMKMGLHLKKRSIDETERNSMLSHAAGHLADQHPEVLSAYVFGSFTREEAFRDLDIGVLLSAPPTEPLTYELKLEGEIEKLVGVPVDVRILNHAPRSFQYTVIREGKLILERDPNRGAAFEWNVIKQYLDFSRFRRRSLEEIARAGI